MDTEKIKVKDGEIEVSKLVLGSSDYLKLDNMEKVDQMFSSYVNHGGRTFDTARHYREAEAVIGEWMKDKKREDFTIITKCCHPVREARDVPRVDPENILKDLTESLKQLQMDYVDSLLLHRDNPAVPVGPLMETLSQLVDEGKIRSFGVSNWELNRVIEAKAYCEDHNLNKMSFNSPNFSLAIYNEPRWANCVTAGENMIEWHRQTNFPLLSWSSQAEAFFAPRFKKEDINNPELKEFTDVYFNDENWRRLERVEKLAKEKNVKPIQISLAYVLSQTFPTFALIGPEEEWQLLESIEAMNLHLTNKEVNYLERGE